MCFDCRKNVFILLGLFSILPICYLIEHMAYINWQHLGAILLIILWPINFSCNNYKLMITKDEIRLERLLGKALSIDMQKVYQIEMREYKDDVRLFIYTTADFYHFSVRNLETDKIRDYLSKKMMNSPIHFTFEVVDKKRYQAII